MLELLNIASKFYTINIVIIVIVLVVVVVVVEI
jgi:hypothetical protein